MRTKTWRPPAVARVLRLRALPRDHLHSTEIRADGGELVVDGELTIKGTTQRVEARGTITGPLPTRPAATRLGIDLETAVDRTEYGLNWNAPIPSGGVAVENEVTLTVHLELARQA